jgi:hypothetical protein
MLSMSPYCKRPESFVLFNAPINTDVPSPSLRCSPAKVGGSRRGICEINRHHISNALDDVSVLTSVFPSVFCAPQVRLRDTESFVHVHDEERTNFVATLPSKYLSMFHHPMQIHGSLDVEQ